MVGASALERADSVGSGFVGASGIGGTSCTGAGQSYWPQECREVGREGGECREMAEGRRRGPGGSEEEGISEVGRRGEEESLRAQLALHHVEELSYI